MGLICIISNRRNINCFIICSLLERMKISFHVPLLVESPSGYGFLRGRRFLGMPPRTFSETTWGVNLIFIRISCSKGLKVDSEKEDEVLGKR